MYVCMVCMYVHNIVCIASNTGAHSYSYMHSMYVCIYSMYLFNEQAIYTLSGSSAGIGFAIPVDTLKYEVDTLLRDGKVVRPALGVTYLESTMSVKHITLIFAMRCMLNSMYCMFMYVGRRLSESREAF